MRGSSVLAHDQAWEYTQDQARQLILKEQFAVALLELNGTIIAFEYGWCAKQVYHSYKVAYNDQYARYSPGHLMLFHLMRHFCTTQSIQAADFLGPVDAAIDRWSSQQYWMGRLLMAPPSTVGRALVFASRYLLTGHTTPVLDAPADAVV